jgi:hypothetical protein
MQTTHQNLAIPARVLFAREPRGITNDEMHFAMHQVLINSNINHPNYFSLVYEGDLRWTMMGSRIEYIAVTLSTCRTLVRIEMIGPYNICVYLNTSPSKNALDVIREGFVKLLRDVNQAAGGANNKSTQTTMELQSIAIEEAFGMLHDRGF